MARPVIKVEGLSKKFIIAHEAPERYAALRDVIAKKTMAIINAQKKNENAREEFFALRDINFEVNAGDRLGIVGRNGAGKSTLLKILSRITEPTGGRITINGRIASLLEVGTGFHPELTGKENIFLNGAILGMSRAEIKKKFEEIVDFAGIEKFLDTPVKRYSSGMYVRLAFAVAAHLEPEILIVDEVLSVGDIEFQKKCLGKMEEVSAKDGRTILFVSHNIEAIRLLCKKGILLEKGSLILANNMEKVIDKYVTSNAKRIFNFESKNSEKEAYISGMYVENEVIEFGKNIYLKCNIFSKLKIDVYIVGISISNTLSVIVGASLINHKLPLEIGENIINIKVPANNLIPGEYSFSLSYSFTETFEIPEAVIGYPFFNIVSNEEYQYIFSKWNPGWGGHLLMDIELTVGNGNTK
jgi:lipopolysaccharide transport system ATP-binding protein